MVTSQSRGQDNPAAEPRSIELRDYALVVRRRWVIVLVTMVLGAALALGYAVHKGRSYAATSEVVVEPVTQGPLDPSAQPNLQVNMATEQAIAESSPVAQLAAGLMHRKLLSTSAQTVVASHLSVTVPLLSDLLQITWQAKSAKAAQQGANAFANAYLTYRHGLLSDQVTRLGSTLSAQVATLQHQIKSVTAQLNNSASGSVQHQNLDATLTQLNGQLRTTSDTLTSLPTYNTSGGKVIDAALPLSPTGLRRSVVLILGALIGLLIGIVAAFVRDAFDDRLRDPAVLEQKLGASTLAILPGDTERAKSRRGAHVTTVTHPGSRAADTFRTLRTVLTSVTAGEDLCSFVVVGVDSSVSSSQVAAELGVALAESGRQTLLIAADIRGSTLPQIFDVSNAAGLTNLLVGKADSETTTQHPKSAGGVALLSVVARNLSLITNGPPLAQPLSILDSVAMARFLKSLRDEYDFVVLDAPPADFAADVLAIARLVDGVVAVATKNRSKGRAAADLRQRLDQIGGHLVGGILVARGTVGNQRNHDHFAAEPIGDAIVTRSTEDPRGDRGGLEKTADQRNGALDAPQRATRGPS